MIVYNPEDYGKGRGDERFFRSMLASMGIEASGGVSIDPLVVGGDIDATVAFPDNYYDLSNIGQGPIPVGSIGSYQNRSLCYGVLSWSITVNNYALSGVGVSYVAHYNRVGGLTHWQFNNQSITANVSLINNDNRGQLLNIPINFIRMSMTGASVYVMEYLFSGVKITW